MPDYGMKASKAGEDVKTAALKDLRFNSEKGAFKILKCGNANFTTDGSGNGSASIAHGASYPPGLFALRKGVAKNVLLSGATEYSNAFFPIGSPNMYVKDDDLHHAIHCYSNNDNANLIIQALGGKPSTAMDFRYYALVDQSGTFTGADGISTPNDYGLKSAKAGFDVLTAKEYQLAFSSKYKILQYFAVNKKSQALTLPRMFTSYHDQDQEEATYVDIIHGLGFAPLSFVYFDSPAMGSILVKAPMTFEDGQDIFNYQVAYFIDATRIRVWFWRRSRFWEPTNTIYGDWDAETITIRVLVTTENLAGAAFP